MGIEEEVAVVTASVAAALKRRECIRAFYGEEGRIHVEVIYMENPLRKGVLKMFGANFIAQSGFPVPNEMLLPFPTTAQILAAIFDLIREDGQTEEQ